MKIHCLCKLLKFALGFFIGQTSLKGKEVFSNTPEFKATFSSLLCLYKPSCAVRSAEVVIKCPLQAGNGRGGFDDPRILQLPV